MSRGYSGGRVGSMECWEPHRPGLIHCQHQCQPVQSWYRSHQSVSYLGLASEIVSAGARVGWAPGSSRMPSAKSPRQTPRLALVGKERSGNERQDIFSRS